ncbi:hypothetical protein [Mycobacteroides abscessus]
MTSEYDELPAVDETVLPRSLRASIFVTGVLKGTMGPRYSTDSS